MIQIENTDVVGWEHAIRGMRNPLNSWSKSDSHKQWDGMPYQVGDADHKLMMQLAQAGSDHRKYQRMLAVYCDITAPLYWWKEFKTYTKGRNFQDEETDAVDDIIFDSTDIEPHIVMNSCSTMHKITEKEFSLDDFSHEHLLPDSEHALFSIVSILNSYRDKFIAYHNYICSCESPEEKDHFSKQRKVLWWQMIQLLPSSYNQRRTLMLSYEVLNRMYHSRKNHKLDEWREFCSWVESLPYSELITEGK